jgi:hypothetical protein
MVQALGGATAFECVLTDIGIFDNIVSTSTSAKNHAMDNGWSIEVTISMPASKSHQQPRSVEHLNDRKRRECLVAEVFASRHDAEHGGRATRKSCQEIPSKFPPSVSYVQKQELGNGQRQVVAYFASQGG